MARALEPSTPRATAGRSVRDDPAHRRHVGAVRPALLLLVGAVALVLLIACANVANLLLARAVRGSGRSRCARRSAPGRWRLARQVLAEAVALAAAGGVLGLLLAAWAVDLLLASAPAGIPRLQEISIDGGVLAFTLVVSPAVGLAFGLVPALSSRATIRPTRSAGRVGAPAGAGGGPLPRRAGGRPDLSRAGAPGGRGAPDRQRAPARRGRSRVSARRAPPPSSSASPVAKYPDADGARGLRPAGARPPGDVPGVQHAGAVFFLPLGSGRRQRRRLVRGLPPPPRPARSCTRATAWSRATISPHWASRCVGAAPGPDRRHRRAPGRRGERGVRATVLRRERPARAARHVRQPR